MQDQDDGLQAQDVAGRIVSAGERGDLPNPDDLDSLANLVQSQSTEVAEQLRLLKEKGDDVSVQDMFEMQMLMNHLSQSSEMNTSASLAQRTQQSRRWRGTSRADDWASRESSPLRSGL